MDYTAGFHKALSHVNNPSFHVEAIEAICEQMENDLLDHKVMPEELVMWHLRALKSLVNLNEGIEKNIEVLMDCITEIYLGPYNTEMLHKYEKIIISVPRYDTLGYATTTLIKNWSWYDLQHKLIGIIHATRCVVSSGDPDPMALRSLYKIYKGLMTSDSAKSLKLCTIGRDMAIENMV
jgi:hypothetical protein